MVSIEQLNITYGKENLKEIHFIKKFILLTFKNNEKHIITKTTKKCPHCKEILYTSMNEDYSHQCFKCDEDFYNAEVENELNENGVIAENGRAILNTTHYAVEVKEDEEKLGIIIDVFHRHGDLIQSHTYWNDDVIDKKPIPINKEITTGLTEPNSEMFNKGCLAYVEWKDGSKSYFETEEIANQEKEREENSLDKEEVY